MKEDIFISYAWEKESFHLVEKLRDTLDSYDISYSIDQENVNYRGNIKEFMQKMGKGNFVIMIVSDKYLKSKNCMYEMFQIKENGDFHDRILPIVLKGAEIRNTTKRLEYISYWESELNQVNERINSIQDKSMIASSYEDVKNLRKILNSFDEFATLLTDLNTLTADIHEESNFLEILSILKKDVILKVAEEKKIMK